MTLCSCLPASSEGSEPDAWGFSEQLNWRMKVVRGTTLTNRWCAKLSKENNSRGKEKTLISQPWIVSFWIIEWSLFNRRCWYSTRPGCSISNCHVSLRLDQELVLLSLHPSLIIYIPWYLATHRKYRSRLRYPHPLSRAEKQKQP